MANPIPIILVSETQSTLEKVQAALAAEGETMIVTHHNLAELAARLEAKEAALVLADLDPQPLAVLNELEPIVNAHPYSRFVALTAQRTPQLILRAMQAGVRHVQAKPDIPDELGAIMRQLLGSLGNEPGSRGLLLTLLSAGGGCGATTLAINLACELRKLGHGPALLVDGDFAYGSVGIALGLDSRFGLADVLSREAAPDAALVQSIVVHDKSGMDVLLNHIASDSIRPRHFETFLDVCRRAWPAVVLDLARPVNDLLTPAVQAAGVVPIVMQATVRDFRVAQALLGRLTRCGLGPSRIVLVLNRYDRHHSAVPLKEIELAFNPVPVVCIRNDYATAMQSATAGRPLGVQAPRAAPARDTARLAMLCLSLAGKLKGEVHAHAYE